MNASLAPKGAGRDHRLDVFRGLALLTIFVNHVPGNVYERFTSRNFGFSDAAEAFVLMSGIAVGLAYSRGFKAGDLADSCLKLWRRAGKLYVTHVVTSAIAIAIIAFGIVFLGTDGIVQSVNFKRFMDMPLQTLIGLPTLGHQIGYFNILPLYFLMLLISPLYIVIGLRSRLALLLLATVIWAAAGTFRLNLPNYPNEGGWFFNPLSWQLIYALGIAAGLSAREGEKLVPYDRWLFGFAVIYLVFALVWTRMELGALPLERQLPFFIGGFDKTFVALPRFLHAVALAYVLTNLAAVARLLAAPAFRPIGLIGQNGLAVFAVGSVLAIALQVFRARFQTTFLEDTGLIFGGILLQYAIARFLSATKEKKLPRQGRKSVVPTVPAAEPAAST